MKRKQLYPGTAEAEEERMRAADRPACFDDEPDILHTAGGYCPNYAKFDAMGWTTEKALIWCNLD